MTSSGCAFIFVYLFILVVLGVELKTLQRLRKHSVPGLNPQPFTICLASLRQAKLPKQAASTSPVTVTSHAGVRCRAGSEYNDWRRVCFDISFSSWQNPESLSVFFFFKFSVSV